MNTDDDKNKEIEKNDELNIPHIPSHFIENITKAQEVFNVSVKPYLGTMQKVSDSVFTISQKIEPLLKIQQQLTAPASSISAVMQKIPTIDPAKFSFLSDGAMQIGQNLQKIQGLAIKSSSLFKEANYDLLANPISSTLSIAVDNVALEQQTILKDLDLITKTGVIVSPDINKWDNTSLKINDVALGILEESPLLFPNLNSATIPIFKDPTTERIEKLENKVQSLKDTKDKSIITEISNEVKELLSKIDDSLLRMFNGAYAVINQNDDSLAQSAESMTRLLETLPFRLVKDFKSKEKIKEKIIKERLAIYLSLQYNSVDDINHPLINQQHYFYETFSQIRHRNKKIYKEFEKDFSRYKALLLQVEGFLYQLIKQ